MCLLRNKTIGALIGQRHSLLILIRPTIDCEYYPLASPGNINQNITPSIPKINSEQSQLSSLFSREIKMSFSSQLWVSNSELAYSSYNSSFVQGIMNGDLPIENFKSYIAQDSFFLEAFAKAYGMAIAKSPDQQALTILGKMVNGVTEELNLHQSYAAKWGVNLEKYSIHSATQAYTDFLYKVSTNGQMVEIISAMTPCMRLYSWLGKLIKNETKKIKNPYEEWIRTYADENFENLTRSLENLLDVYSEQDKLNHLKTLYKNAMRLELLFFQAYSP